MANSNMVNTYKDSTGKGVRYGIHYEFNNSYSDTVVRKLNEVCDEIVFRETFFCWCGKYPKDMITLGGTRKVHDVILEGLTLDQAKRVGIAVAKYLKVPCKEEKEIMVQ